MCDFFLPVTVTSLKRDIGFHIISSNILNLYQHRTWHTLFFVCQTDMIYDSELSRKETIMMYLMIEDDNPGNMIYWKVPTNWIAADSYLRTAQPPTALGVQTAILVEEIKEQRQGRLIADDQQWPWRQELPIVSNWKVGTVFQCLSWRYETFTTGTILQTMNSILQTIQKCVNFRARFVHTHGIPEVSSGKIQGKLHRGTPMGWRLQSLQV